MTNLPAEKLDEILTDILEQDIITIKKSNKFSDLPSWDSLRYVRLIISIQQNFLIKMDPDDVEKIISYDTLSTILTSYIEKK